jgi:hypothetical protein
LTFIVSDSLSGVVTQASVLGKLPDIDLRIDGNSIPISFDEFDRNISSKTIRIRCSIDISYKADLIESNHIDLITRSGRKYSLKDMRVSVRDSNLRCEMLLVESDT